MSQIVNDNLVATRKRLLNEITFLSFKELNTPVSNTWNVAQVCHHLFLTEKAFTKAIIYGLEQSNVQKVEPISIQFISDRSKKFDAPSMVRPSKESFELFQLTNMLNESRAMLLGVLSNIKDESILTEKSVIHPLFGEIPLNQIFELIYLHELRHIEQIKEIKSHTI